MKNLIIVSAANPFLENLKCLMTKYVGWIGNYKRNWNSRNLWE